MVFLPSLFIIVLGGGPFNLNLEDMESGSVSHKVFKFRKSATHETVPGLLVVEQAGRLTWGRTPPTAWQLFFAKQSMVRLYRTPILPLGSLSPWLQIIPLLDLP